MATTTVFRAVRRPGRLARMCAALLVGGCLLAACGGGDKAADGRDKVTFLNILPLESLTFTPEMIADTEGLLRGPRAERDVRDDAGLGAGDPDGARRRGADHPRRRHGDDGRDRGAGRAPGRGRRDHTRARSGWSRQAEADHPRGRLPRPAHRDPVRGRHELDHAGPRRGLRRDRPRRGPEPGRRPAPGRLRPGHAGPDRRLHRLAGHRGAAAADRPRRSSTTRTTEIARARRSTSPRRSRPATPRSRTSCVATWPRSRKPRGSSRPTSATGSPRPRS